MAALVIATHDNASLKEATAKVVAAAAKLGGDVDVLVAGENAGAAAQAAAKIAGVRKVLHADGATLGKQLAEPMEALIAPLAAQYDAVFFAADTSGKNVAPRIAAKLDVMQVSGVIDVLGPKTFVRTIYAGNAVLTVESSDSKIVATIQPTAFKPTGDGGSASVETIAAPGAGKSVFVGEEIAKSDRPELAGAKRVVSGGRALGSAEEFKKVIEPLADLLGAAVGASRAAVDAGYAPNDYQVGQTGKVVAPELYVAIGISGAIQHLAGMKDSKVIVALNKDEDAPIFQISDYGLVADYKVAVPELEAE
ncbi:MAG: electron transfer flavoprotein subunit alpha/FixB family protein, partial [Alphaproteobacteria bacterium]|nr:electron transfer flavoprotein subunit alpha/FixB family protein [Alphaproteobacteria bacterium]